MRSPLDTRLLKPPAWADTNYTSRIADAKQRQQGIIIAEWHLSSRILVPSRADYFDVYMAFPYNHDYG
jgi:hypothetical protein